MRYIFASDAHLGLNFDGKAGERADRFLRFLRFAQKEIEQAGGGALFLLGDIFDFWFEYKGELPHGFDDIVAALKDVQDSGIDVHFFKGNHDMWMVGELERHTGINVYSGNKEFVLFDKKYLMGHGDSLGVNLFKNPTYAIIRCLLTAKFTYWFTRNFVPKHTMTAAGYGWSKSSRLSKNIAHTFRGEQEPIVEFCRNYTQKNKVDYFVFGHLHTPTKFRLNDTSELIILGEWIGATSYMLLDKDSEPTLLQFEE